MVHLYLYILSKVRRESIYGPSLHIYVCYLKFEGNQFMVHLYIFMLSKVRRESIYGPSIPIYVI